MTEKVVELEEEMEENNVAIAGDNKKNRQEVKKEHTHTHTQKNG